MIKLCLAGFLLVIRSLMLSADPGPAYIFLIEVSYDKEKVTGYTYIGSGYMQEVEDVYTSDSMFTSFVLNWNAEDSLYLYREVYLIDSLNIEIYFKDKLLKIDEKKISQIRLIKIIDSGFGNWVSHERFEIKDLIWLKKSYIRKEEYWDYYCSYTVYFFEEVEPDKEFNIKSKKYMNDNFYLLSQKEQDKWNELRSHYFKRLEKYKVIIHWHDCSC